MPNLHKSIFLGVCLLLAGCASKLPRPGDFPAVVEGPGAEALLAACLAAHGGDLRDSVTEVRLSLTGEWGSLIQRIQPLVTDAGWRIDASERHWIAEGRSETEWSGPNGIKGITWQRPDITVQYNGEATGNSDVLAASAMTTTAFQLFHLGPNFLAWNAQSLTRLPDVTIDGRRYHQIYGLILPGFGFSEEDEVVAFIDAQTLRLFRVWITLNGFATTQGASVDVTYLDYTEVDGHLFPTHMVERVRAPLSLHAHEWWTRDIRLIGRE